MSAITVYFVGSIEQAKKHAKALAANNDRDFYVDEIKTSAGKKKAEYVVWLHGAPTNKIFNVLSGAKGTSLGTYGSLESRDRLTDGANTPYLTVKPRTAEELTRATKASHRADARRYNAAYGGGSSSGRPEGAIGQVIRTVRFAPYRKGMGPTFTLSLWDTNKREPHGRLAVGYRLTQKSPTTNKTETLFEGSDFSSPHSIDSDKAVQGIMGFLTLKPGDTDRDYFEKYTPRQMDFAGQHAEALSMDVIDRFGEN